ncbi:MAG: GAF domain-containing protein [Deltaproteobacteria bacterium]|nr:GAF domain-containing protein [Deltaproteobacteria bacterium]
MQVIQKLLRLPFFQVFGGQRRGRLVRHYFFISGLLIGGGLITSGLLEIYFRYYESQEHLALLQQEITAGAAFKIERFIQEIQGTMKAATRSREIAPRGLTPEYRFELEKLLLIAPAITEAVALGEDGTIRVQASRLRTVLPEAKRDLVTSAAFQETKQGKSYFGPVYFVRGSEPYMTLAVPIERFASDVIGVLQTEVNLKYIGELVSGMKVGRAGYAYLVTRSGDLVAHPDISLVLQRRNVAGLNQVKAAFQAAPGLPKQKAVLAQNLQGTKVFSSYAFIPSLDWAVLIERPVGEAYEPLYASIIRTSSLLLIGLGMALLASFLVARRVVRPLQTLHKGVERIASGDLGARLEIKTGDEIEMLAEEFNKMTAQLQESYANLEQKVEERTRELSESLEQQTATSEILRVISSSPTDIQPVLDAVAENAARLCDATDAQIWLVEGQKVQRAAAHGSILTPNLEEGRPITRTVAGCRAILDRDIVHIPDISAPEAQREFPDSWALAQESGVRTILANPLLREGTSIGFILIRRTEVRPFSNKQIKLLETFADQAVIAIENVRLFQELQARTRELARSVEELKALGELGQAVSSTLDLQTVLTTVVARAVELSGTDGGVIYEYDEGTKEFHLRATQRIEEEMVEALRAAPIHLGEGAVGRAAVIRAPAQIIDILDEREYTVTRLRPMLAQLGYRSLLAIPLLREERIMGGLVVLRREAGGFSTEVMNLLQTFATQSVLAIQNAKLFREIEEKGFQLEMANRHKSQFLANVSHELRTPLNAIIGFTRLVLRKIEGQIPDLQRENLQKVLISAEHLLNLINGLLDLAKIEAGKIEVFAEKFKLDDVITVATSTVEPMLKDGRVRLVKEIAPDILPLNTDRDKLKQVILNLLSNAAKFTEQGEIKVSAWQEDNFLKLVVSDTGIGMKKEALEYIFEEFRQADMSSTRKYGGTGLGLAIVKKFVNLMGGDIGVESEVGKGSKFTITLPMSLAGR